MTADAALEALGADCVALDAAAAAAQDALCLQREALAVLVEAWGGESGSAAADLIRRQCAEGADVVAELQRASGDVALRRDRLADGSDPGMFDVGAARGEAAGMPAAPAVPPAQPVPPPAPGAWAPAGMPLAAGPDVGGTLAALVAQFAELIGSGVDLPAEESIEEPIEGLVGESVREPAEAAGQPREPSAVGQPQPVQSPAQPPPAPVAVPTLPPAVMPQQESSVPQQESPRDAAMAASPEPEPLLAAEVPAPVQRAADPVPDPPTPCEIAADELPEVGG